MSLRVGILGVAHLHVWSYVAALKTNPKGRIVGVWDHEPTRKEEFARQAGLAAFHSVQSLLAECDAVCITSENSKHADLAEAAANAGKHILCEKPLVITEAQAAQMLRAVERSGVKLMTAFPCRF